MNPSEQVNNLIAYVLFENYERCLRTGGEPDPLLHPQLLTAQRDSAQNDLEDRRLFLSKLCSDGPASIITLYAIDNNCECLLLLTKAIDQKRAFQEYLTIFPKIFHFNHRMECIKRCERLAESIGRICIWQRLDVLNKKRNKTTERVVEIWTSCKYAQISAYPGEKVYNRALVALALHTNADLKDSEWYKFYSKPWNKLVGVLSIPISMCYAFFYAYALYKRPYYVIFISTVISVVLGTVIVLAIHIEETYPTVYKIMEVFGQFLRMILLPIWGPIAATVELEKFINAPDDIQDRLIPEARVYLDNRFNEALIHLLPDRVESEAGGDV